MDQVRRHPARYLLELGASLLLGTYSPQPVRQFDLAKADGSTRRLTVFAVSDRVVQRACLTVLQPLAEQLFLDCSYGFRPGLTVGMAYNRVREWVRAGYWWLVDADIERCFDTIPHRHALALLRALCGDSRLAALVGQWLCAPGLAPTAACGLPQGMALSPLLCNLVLHRLDMAMQRLQIPMVRFADDFVCLARSHDDAQRAHDAAADCLRLGGQALHAGKTRVLRCNRRLRFLGQPLPRLSLARAWAAPYQAQVN